MRGIIPNITIKPHDNLSEDYYRGLSNLCGAIAISVSENGLECQYNAIKKLSQDYNMDQINIHIVLAEETIPFIKRVIQDIKTDDRLSKLNAMVMLSFKDKSGTGFYNPIKKESYADLLDYCEENNVRFGFDSCSAPLYIDAVKNRKNCKTLIQYAEPCESGLFSIYINVYGEIFMCSFGEGVDCWKDGISVLESPSVLDIWNGPKMSEWREKLIKNKRKCPIYSLGE